MTRISDDIPGRYDAQKACGVRLHYESEKTIETVMLWDKKVKELWRSGIHSVEEAEILNQAFALKDHPDVPKVMEKRQRLLLSRWISSVCSLTGFPTPPPAKTSAVTVKDRLPIPGVYFCWDGPRCLYVGKSINIGRRIPHKSVRPKDDVSWLEFPAEDMDYAELFYIAILRPIRNRVASKRKESQDHLSFFTPS